MLKSKKTILLLVLIMSFMIPVASYGFEDWQSDLDTDNRGNLTVQQYDVYTLPYGSQGSSNSTANWNNNVKVWENRSIIFDNERLFRDPYYVTAQISTKREGRNLDIIFYNNRANYGDASKQALKAWGYFVPTTTGYYRFKIESDDGAYAEIYTNETNLNHSKSEATVLINNMNVSFYNDGQSPVVRLEANKAYPIYLEYFNWGGDGLFTLKYAKSTSYSTVANSPSYSYVNKDMLYPSKKDDFFKQHGSTSALIPVLNNAKGFYEDYKGSQDPDVIALKNLIDKCDLIVEEYYNYSQAEIDKAKQDLQAQIAVVQERDVVVKQPYPDDLLIDSKGKITVQTYDVKNLKSVYEAGSSREENVRNWTNEKIVFSEDRKSGPPELYTAEIIKNTINAAENKVFFYDGGGDYGYAAKEAREGWGYFVPNRTGYYQFKSLFDDGIKAYIYLNENDLKHESSEATTITSYYAIGTFTKESGSMYLEAGKPYPIYINHFNWHGPNRLALQYRFATTTSGLTGVYKDTPSSWFYGSDKNDFLLIHGDKTSLAEKIESVRAILNGSNNLSSDQKSRLETLLTSADKMVDKYYNYLEVEFNNMIKAIDDTLSGSMNGSPKIRKYISGDREYIEVIDDFNESSLDKNLWKSSSYGRTKLANGALYADPSSKLFVNELFNDYDHIEITVDQLFNGTVFKGGVGVSGNNGDIIQHLYNEYYRNYYYSDDFANTGMEGSHWFDIRNHQNYSTKIVADKDINGGYKVTLQIFDYSNKNSQLIYLDNYTDINTIDNYLMNQIMLATRRADGHVYANTNIYSIFDNFKIEAYKELKSLNVDIKDFTATTVGNNIKLTWSTDDTGFDSFEIREIVNGNVMNIYSNIPGSQREKSDIQIGGSYNDRVFEIIAKRGNRYSNKALTNWYGGIENTSVTGFNNSDTTSNILLTWDRPSTSIYDGYIIYEIKDGREVLVKKVNNSTFNLSVPKSSNDVRRTFRLYGYKGNNQSNYSETIWEEPILYIIPTNFTAATSGDGNGVITSWTKPRGEFDKYLIVEYINGVEVKRYEVDKSLTSKNIPLNGDQSDREYRIYTMKSGRYSYPATTTWTNPLKDVKVGNFQANTAESGTDIVLTWNKPNSDITGYVITEIVNGKEVEVKKINDPNTTTTTIPNDNNLKDRKFIIYAVKDKFKSLPVESIWDDGISLISINDFKGITEENHIKLSWNVKDQGVIDGFVLFETIGDRDVEIASNISKLTTDYTVPFNDSSSRVFKIRAYKGTKYSKWYSVTWKDAVSTTNKDKNKNDYVDLDNNTKVTTHDSNFGLAIEINVGENPIYAPSLEFMIQGNEYLTYENPKLYLYDSNKKRISSKVVIEYDANAYAYKAQIIPIGIENNALATGTYYANLETKTIVNTDKYTQRSLVELYKENKVINDWELAYYIDDITDSKTGKKIIEGLGIQFDINFKPSPNGQVRKIESEDIKLELKSKAILPGGY